jgi:predicted DCC family thiol-disulfide oxidoreductase YuxK
LTSRSHHVLFFDGVCGLCDKTVHFLLKRDRRDRIRFAPLQGKLAAEVLPPLGGRPEQLDTLYFLTRDGRLLQKSQAVLAAVGALGGAWALLGVLRVVPRPVLDVLYNFVARVRYRVFGKYETCGIPSAEERARFLESSLPDPQTASMSTIR